MYVTIYTCYLKTQRTFCIKTKENNQKRKERKASLKKEEHSLRYHHLAKCSHLSRALMYIATSPRLAHVLSSFTVKYF